MAMTSNDNGLAELAAARNLLRGQFAYDQSPETYLPGDFTTAYDDVIDRALALVTAEQAATIDTLRTEWTDHRERCHHMDPDGVIAHALAVNDEQAATIATLRAALEGLANPELVDAPGETEAMESSHAFAAIRAALDAAKENDAR
jgi:hypothetical protein